LRSDDKAEGHPKSRELPVLAVFQAEDDDGEMKEMVKCLLHNRFKENLIAANGA
jgi:hypothetical protein